MVRHDMEQFSDFASELANVAQSELAQFSSRGILTEYKEDDSPVTYKDRDIELALRRCIEKRFPEHGIWGEEFGTKTPDADYVWVLDPIDGTSAFVAGMPTYCTLVGLCFRGRPILGLIYNVETRNRWFGMDGAGSFVNGTPLKTRPCANLSSAVITTYSPDMFEGYECDVLSRITSGARMTIYGGNSYAYGRLAGGFADAGIEARHDVSDYIPLAPIIRNAGGIITDWAGNDLTLSSQDKFIATGDSRLHTELCALISDEMIKRESSQTRHLFKAD